MAIEDDLVSNIKEFIASADDDLFKRRYNSAIGTYFKAIATICDLNIYRQKRILPKNHSERFLFLKMSFLDVYKIVNKLFEKYTKTYNLRLSKDDAQLFKENVKKINQLFKEKA
ncbi:MAG: hypothetical protein ABIB79_00635 [archaeon]